MSIATPPELHGKVLQGTCGWTDSSATFYPPTANRSTEDRLAYYCRKLFPCVEVDSSCYKIPNPEHVARWVKQVLPGFKFHFKAFGMFCQQSVPLTTIPYMARQMLTDAQAGSSKAGAGASIAVADLPAGAEQACWDAYNAALEPAVKAGHMGCVVFQFHLSFLPSAKNRDHILRCRQQLRQDVPMAVELRNRSWFQEPEDMQELSAWCTTHGLALVAADELRHETFQRDRDQRGLPPDQVRQLLPISLAVTRPDFLYVRLHRRHGTTDRLLAAEEYQAWSARLAPLTPQLQGPIYFMWGTDWADAPVANARALSAALPSAMSYDHASAAAKLLSGMRGSITSFFTRANHHLNSSAGISSKQVQRTDNAQQQQQQVGAGDQQHTQSSVHQRQQQQDLQASAHHPQQLAGQKRDAQAAELHGADLVRAPLGENSGDAGTAEDHSAQPATDSRLAAHVGHAHHTSGAWQVGTAAAGQQEQAVGTGATSQVDRPSAGQSSKSGMQQRQHKTRQVQPGHTNGQLPIKAFFTAKKSK